MDLMGFGVAKTLQALNHQRIQVPNLDVLLPQKAVKRGRGFPYIGKKHCCLYR